MNWKLGIWMATVGTIIWSCQKAEELPLPPETLVDVIADIHLSESAMYLFNDDIKDSIGRVYYQQVFDIHQIDSTDFNRAIEMIRKDPKLMMQVYRKVFEKIEGFENDGIPTKESQ